MEARDRTSTGNQVISATGFESQEPKSFDCKFFVIFVFFVVDKYYHMSQELTVEQASETGRSLFSVSPREKYHHEEHEGHKVKSGY
ncbi:MAG: hypothetical protein ACE10H_03080 [Candidatus Binatia bacterium]